MSINKTEQPAHRFFRRLAGGTLLSSLLLGELLGCWASESEPFEAFWSDDDTMFAIGVTHRDVLHDGRNTGSDRKFRNESQQIYLAPADNSEDPTPITAREEAGSTFYLMNAAGYLVVNWGFGSHSSIRLYYMDGDSEELADSRDLPAVAPEGAPCTLSGIPSPTGQYIAIVRVCRPVDDPGADLSIIEASTFKELLPRTRTQAFDGEVWTPQDEFAVFVDSSDALFWRPGQEGLVQARQPACKGPPTTSGPTSEEGRIVGPGNSLEDPVELDAKRPNYYGGSLKPFGCP